MNGYDESKSGPPVAESEQSFLPSDKKVIAMKLCREFYARAYSPKTGVGKGDRLNARPGSEDRDGSEDYLKRNMKFIDNFKEQVGYPITTSLHTAASYGLIFWVRELVEQQASHPDALKHLVLQPNFEGHTALALARMHPKRDGTQEVISYLENVYRENGWVM